MTLDVQYHKVQETLSVSTLDASDTIDGAQQQPLHCKQSCNPWDGCQWGLITTAAVQPGEVLLSVPRQSVVITHKPDQTLLQMACLAFDQASAWYSQAASRQLGTQTAAVEQGHQQGQGHEHGQGQGQRQETGTVGGAEQGGQAQAGKGQHALGELVRAWIQPGRVELTLPGRLLMAQLWPNHVSSVLGRQCSQALSGVLYPPEASAVLAVEHSFMSTQGAPPTANPTPTGPSLKPASICLCIQNCLRGSSLTILCDGIVCEIDVFHAAGLPVELEVMAEAEEAVQKMRQLLPQLQELMRLQGQSCHTGAGLFQAHVAILWAVTCMDRCGRSNPSGQGLLLAPAVSALPQVRLHCDRRQTCFTVVL